MTKSSHSLTQHSQWLGALPGAEPTQTVNLGTLTSLSLISHLKVGIIIALIIEGYMKIKSVNICKVLTTVPYSKYYKGLLNKMERI